MVGSLAKVVLTLFKVVVLTVLGVETNYVKLVMVVVKLHMETKVHQVSMQTKHSTTINGVETGELEVCGTNIDIGNFKTKVVLIKQLLILLVVLAVQPVLVV